MMMMQRGLLEKLTARLMPPQIIQPRKSPLTSQMVKLADHMLMLRLMACHVPFKVTSLGIQPLLADVAVHLISVVAAGDVVVAHLLVHE